MAWDEDPCLSLPTILGLGELRNTGQHVFVRAWRIACPVLLKNRLANVVFLFLVRRCLHTWQGRIITEPHALLVQCETPACRGDRHYPIPFRLVTDNGRDQRPAPRGERSCRTMGALGCQQPLAMRVNRCIVINSGERGPVMHGVVGRRSPSALTGKGVNAAKWAWTRHLGWTGWLDIRARAVPRGKFLLGDAPGFLCCGAYGDT
jgi:hypothetical protein